MRRIIALLLLVLLLAGCAAPSKELPEDNGSSVTQAEAPKTESIRASMVASSARPLLEAEILSAYDRALRVYSWFDLAPLSASNETALIDGEMFRLVDMDGVENLEDLRTYLRSVFSEELTDRLLDGETARIQYRDIGGKLYVSGSRRNRDSDTGAIRVETEQFDETMYFVNVLVELLSEDGETVVGQGSWSFPYAFVDDRWVFTDFALVY